VAKEAASQPEWKLIHALLFLEELLYERQHLNRLIVFLLAHAMKSVKMGREATVHDSEGDSEIMSQTKGWKKSSAPFSSSYLKPISASS